MARRIPSDPHDNPTGWGHERMLIFLAGSAAQRLALEGSELGWRRQRRPSELRAFHEAGHAVVGAIFGHVIYRLTIVSDADCRVGRGDKYISGGVCSFVPVDSTPARTRASTDEHTAARLAFGFEPLVPDSLPPWRRAIKIIHEYRSLAEGLLRANWLIVQKLAWELEGKKTLGKDEIAAILR